MSGCVHHQITRELADVAMGRKPADLILENGKLVDVCTAGIREKCDVAVYKGIIALTGDASHVLRDEGTRVVDVTGQYICPGLIDSHMHVESAMVDLPAFAAGVLVHGTTTICPDIHEITNVLGMDALTLFQESAKQMPLKVLTAMPVCVPSLPGMEDAAARITPEDVQNAYDRGLAFLQGEQMNFPGVIFGDESVHQITAAALKSHKVLTGHYAGEDLNAGLNAYVASGITADHETTTAQGALARAQLGMYVQQRYGSAWLDLPNLITAVLENPGMDTRFFTLVTDDVTPATIHEKGHLVRVVRKAISLGLNPITAIQMATLNPAQMLNQSSWIGSVTPGRAADLLVLGSLSDFSIHQVYCDGALVAEIPGSVAGHPAKASQDAKEGAGCQLVCQMPQQTYPDWALNTLYLDPVAPDAFKIHSRSDDPLTARVIELLPGSVLTRSGQQQMVPQNKEILADPSRDIAKAAMFFRHKPGTDAQGTKGLGLVSGTGFKPGTAYASSVSHDCHNLLVVGTDDGAMALAANTLIQSQGGIAVVENNAVAAHLALPLGGLMSLEPVEIAAQKVRQIEQALETIGCPHPAFEMTMSLIGLVVLGELRLSNRGLVEMKAGRAPEFVDLFI